MKNRSAKSGFSLVELLVVMTILIAVASLAAPAFNQLGSAYQLTATAQSLTGEFSLARQTAITRNIPVEVRIYQDDSGNFTTLALAIPDGNDPAGEPPKEWIGQFYEISDSIVLDLSQNGTFSTMLVEGASAEAPYMRVSPDESPERLQGRSYLTFHFSPDGSTNLPATDGAGDPAFYTLSLRTNSINGASPDRPAQNFVALMLDPVVGRIRTFQP